MSRVVRIKQAIATHRHEWGKWPDTEDRDYSDVMAKRDPWQFDLGDGTTLILECRYLPVFKAYLDAHDERLPVQFPWIDNTKPPAMPVIVAELDMLRAAALDGCVALYWEHAHQCSRAAAELLRGMFRHVALTFSDDMAGSSDVKTFPVAHAFDSVIHGMMVYDYATGRLTAPEYISRGVSRCYHISQNACAGLTERLAEIGFDLERKATAVERGDVLPLDFAFVGMADGWPWRAAAMKALNREGVPGVSKLYGVGMRDGQLGSRWPYTDPRGLGADCADVYSGALCSVNVPQSSIFNTRLVDLWSCGVVQILHDQHSELAGYGIKPGVHYQDYDGTHADLVAKIYALRSDHVRAAAFIRAGREALELLKPASWTEAHRRMYRDALPQIEAGR